ncbi:TBC1 domain family member 20 [Arctopsyche grandis]|uniref:TBC1 domain family member 20 n=1 Tax=Arctopsyche grandis TaxID=121162 RepID=UPI00406DA412
MESGSMTLSDIAAPSRLQFDREQHKIKYRAKEELLKEALAKDDTSLEQWIEFAKGDGGLVNDSIRKTVWPVLVGVTKDEISDAPSLSSLSGHDEYNQVVLDVNRSLKRFPPGIPYKQRVALQDQLTVLILRVIIKYPHLKYYQGYHDVAITLLLVCKEKAAFPVLCRLSHGDLAPLAPFMQVTMEPTQHLLNFLHPLIRLKNEQLADFLKKSTVGTMFALPWFLTWFGHSLNRYTDVVRLYDYFLCSPPMFPIYVTAAIVLFRAVDIFELDCDMATVHCFLSELPEDLPFEDILKEASDLYNKFTPESMREKVLLLEKLEEQQRLEDEERAKRRQIARRGANNNTKLNTTLRQLRQFVNDIPLLEIVPRRYRALLATATLFAGVYAFYKFDYSGFNYIR